MQTKHHWPLGFSSNSPVLWPRTISWGGDEMGNSVMRHVTPSCDLTEGGRWSENSLTIEDINVKKSKFIRSSNFFDVMRYHHIQYLTFLMFFVWKSNLRGQWIWWIRNPATLFVFSKKKHNRTAYLWRDAMCLQELLVSWRQIGSLVGDALQQRRKKVCQIHFAANGGLCFGDFLKGLWIYLKSLFCHGKLGM